MKLVVGSDQATMKKPTNTAISLITRYFHKVQKQACLPEKIFNSNTPFIQLPFSELQKGILSAEMTAEIFKKAKNEKSSSCSLIVSLVTAKLNGSESSGLLLVPCSVDKHGVLSGSPADGEPWIPARWLKYPGNANLTIGSLADLWNFRTRTGVSQASRVDSWSDFLSYAVSLFESVVGKKLCDWAESFDTDFTVSINTDKCYLTVGENIIANKAIVELYPVLEKSLATYPVPLYEKLVSVRDSTQRIDTALSDQETYVESMLKSCGNMGSTFPLTHSQRTALHAFLADSKEDITAVSGPPGTGKTTMLQAVVANLVTQHALRGDDAPFILCTSTNNQAVTNIIDSFSSVGTQEQGGVDTRWLPDADISGGVGPLRGLATYCPSVSKYETAKKRGYLVDSVKKAGVYTDYSAPGYIDLALAYFQRQAAEYFPSSATEAGTSAAAIQRKLRQQLKNINRLRSQLITNFSDYIKTPSTSQVKANEQECATKAKEYEEYQQAMQRWEALKDSNQSFFKKLFRRSQPDEYVIAANKQVGETFPPEVQTLSDVRDFYLQKLSQCECQWREADSSYRNLLERVSRGRIAGQDLVNILEELCATGVITTEQSQTIRNMQSLSELDEILDVTLRYREFWLAVHYYEASWLRTAENNEFILKEDRWRTTEVVMEKYWPQACALTPCFVMTAYQVPRYLSLWAGRQEQRRYSFSRADLLIVDEAGQIDTSIGAAAFAFAKRALVVGDERQLAPIWNIDPISDERLATAPDLTTGVISKLNDMESHWEIMKRRGLTASQPSSIMKAASHACNWAYLESSGQPRPGLFLSEHFRCHSGIIGFCNELIYNEKLVPSRPAKSYPLSDKVSNPFMFYLIEGTHDHTVGSSRVNQQEADAVASWIRDNYDFFETRYCGGDKDGGARLSKNSIIGVVTPFAAQADRIKLSLRKSCPDIARHITVGTAHSLQGAERPVIVFSSVYGETSERAAFIDNTLELMNVAVSRAKDLFVVVGCLARWKDQGSVFSLARKYAQEPTVSPFVFSDVQDPPKEEKLYEKSYWTERGYKIAAAMLKDWGSPMSARKLNTALIEDDYVTRDQDGVLWPTCRGIKAGIVTYQGVTRDGRTFVNLCYSPQAQELIRKLYG